MFGIFWVHNAIAFLRLDSEIFKVAASHRLHDVWYIYLHENHENQP